MKLEGFKPERNKVFHWELKEGGKMNISDESNIIHFSYQSPFQLRKSAEASSQANSLCFADFWPQGSLFL